MSNILPCPFCAFEVTEEVMNGADHSLECLNCHAQGPYVDPVLEDVIEAWNSRYPDTTHVVEEHDFDDGVPRI